MNLSKRPITGKEAETALDRAGITVNKNTVPNEKRSPFVTSGIRIGTPALTSRGMKEDEMKIIAGWISKVLEDPAQETLLLKTKDEVKELCTRFPIYRSAKI
jgi:glycine hydroxymethyltransferase